MRRLVIHFDPSHKDSPGENPQRLNLDDLLAHSEYDSEFELMRAYEAMPTVSYCYCEAAGNRDAKP
jgi:hypothetical protein